MTIGLENPSDFAGLCKKDDDPVLIICRKEKAGILGSGLVTHKLVAGARNVLKIPSIPFKVAIIRPLAA